jgi:tRNA(adenine34) deaminase
MFIATDIIRIIMLQTTHDQDLFYMRKALELAKLAEQNGEVPVGAVLVKDGQIIADGYNTPISSCDPSAHAELIAIRQAAKVLNNYRLVGTTLYVTLEPCVMCAGVLMHARVERLVFGAPEPKTGAFGGAIDLYATKRWNHKIKITPEILSEESSRLLMKFFQARRLPKEIQY